MNDNPWIDYDGRAIPEIDMLSIVEIRTRGGTTSEMRAGAVNWLYGKIIWELDGDPMPSEAEVVAYRLTGRSDTLCPGCKEAAASDRQKKHPERCLWCGYDHNTGAMPQLVSASGGFGL